MERLFNEACDPKQLSPLTLAFVGDAAFELFVRERLVCLANCPVKKLHQNAVAQVRCQAQAKKCQYFYSKKCGTCRLPRSHRI